MRQVCLLSFPTFAFPAFGLLLLVFAGGCAAGGSGTYVPLQQNLIAFDFSDYAEAGFTITPEGYDESYKSIGMISMTIRPEARKVRRCAEEMGANGIINFSVRGTARPVAADLSLPEYTVSGFAVLLFQE